MKPPAFRYWAPQTLPQALDGLWHLVEQGLTVKVLAGGQSLMPILNMRLVTPDVVVDLNGLEEALSYVKKDQDVLRIGALTRHYRLETDPLIHEEAPVIAEAERWIGHVAIRSRGTIGGSVVHADPSAELPLVVTLLQGDITVRSKDHCRVVSVPDFFLTYLTTNVEPNEIVTEIAIPALPPRSAQALEEFALRHGDFAVAAAAAQITVSAEGKMHQGRLALGGMGPTPLDVSDFLAPLQGLRLERKAVAEVAQRIGEDLSPDGDIHADSQYRKDLAVTLSAQAIEKAWRKAQETLDR